VNLLLTGQGEGSGWGFLVALLGEFASQVLVFELDFLDGDGGRGGYGIGP